MSTRETIKMKTPEGESKQTLLGDGADGEEYVKHLMSFHQYLESWAKRLISKRPLRSP
jgi:hypothetical protein